MHAHLLSSARRRLNRAVELVLPTITKTASRPAKRLSLIEGLEQRTLFNAGGFDTQFGTGGLVEDSNSGGIAKAVAIQQDGKEVLGAGINGNFGFERLNFNGSLDTPFGQNGVISVNAGTTALGQATIDTVNGIAVQPDGKIVVVGSATLQNNNSDLVIARFNPDGSLDTAFGSGGLIVSAAGSTIAELRSVAIDTDNSIVVGGDLLNGANGFDWFLARYSSTGAQVNTAVITASTGGDTINSIAIQSDGKIVAGTTFADAGPLTIARFNSNLTLDSTFGSGGRTAGFGDLTTRGGTINSVAIQSDGKIVGVGQNQGFFVVVRYNTNGTLDTSFGSSQGPIGTTSGFVLTDPTPGFDEAFGVAIQTTGQIIAVGGINSGGEGGIVRWTASGDLDTTFGNGGLETIDTGGSPQQLTGIAQQSDGNFVVSARSFAGGSDHVTAARFLGFQSHDESFTGDFNGDGKPDIVFRDDVTGQDTLRLMNGLTTISDNPMVTVSDRNMHIVGIGDLDRDGVKDDIVWDNWATGQISVWFMNGTSIVSTRNIQQYADLSAHAVAVGDVDDDGTVNDIVLENLRTAQLFTLFNLDFTPGGLAFESGLLPVQPDLDWRVAAIGNYTGGAGSFSDDIVEQNTRYGFSGIWLMSGTTRTSVALIDQEPLVRQFTGSGDFSGDGKDDILARNYVNSNNPVFQMNGSTLVTILSPQSGPAQS